MLVVGQMMHKKHPSHFTEPQKLWEFTSFLRAVGSVSVCLWSDVSGGQLILFVVLIKTQCNTVDWETKKKKMQQQQMRGQNPHWGNPSENNMFFQVVCFMSTSKYPIRERWGFCFFYHYYCECGGVSVDEGLLSYHTVKWVLWWLWPGSDQTAALYYCVVKPWPAHLLINS